MTGFDLAGLQATIEQRGKSGDAQSWTAKLFNSGIEKASQKLGEEAVETIIAAVSGQREAVISESADLIYHWLVVLSLSGVKLEEVVAELERRTGISGIAEKAARPKA